MNKKLSITLLVAMFSLLIIGFGGTATAEAAENCLGIASTDMTAVELVDCLSDSAYQAANPELMVSHRFVIADGSAASQPASSDSAYQAANPDHTALDRNYGTFAGLWTGIIDREVAADPDRAALDRNYGTFAGLWTGIIDREVAADPELMVSHRFVVADGSATAEPAPTGSAYQAANPELMVTHRFVVADGSATGQPVSVDIEVLRNNYYNSLRGTQTDPTVEPVDIEVRNHNYYDNLWTARRGDSPAIQTDPVAEPVDIGFLRRNNPNYYHPGR